MKVVQVLPDLNGGGVERGTLEVAEALVAAGHTSLVISAGGAMVAELEAAGSRHIQWDLGRKSLLTLRHITAVRKWLKQEKPDIIHLRSRMPAWIVWLAWRGLPDSARPHLVTTVHGLYSVSWYSEIMCKGERVIAVSDTVKAYIARNYPQTDLQRIVRIFRGVDQDTFPYGYKASEAWCETWFEQYPQLRGKVVLTLPGRLTRLKGHHVFIDLIHRMKAQGINVCGLIVGGEDPKRKAYAQELVAKVEALELVDDVIFTGARKDIKEIYSISDVVLSLSTKPESFGRTVLESLRLGIPTVGYDHGGVGEILSEIFPQGRVALNDESVLDNTVRRILEESSAPLASNAFTRKTMLDKTLAVYQELVQPFKSQGER